MIITVDRIFSEADSTISLVKVDGKAVCFGLEDEYHAEKVVYETRVPAGTYPVRVRSEGGFHNCYGRKFADIHRGMLHIQDVPEFEFILIHVGNTDENTAGCLLVGTGAMAWEGDMSIQASVEAYRNLYSMVIEAAHADDLSIEILDSDRMVA